ncbi:cysteine-rich receptor-like protein kinase 25 [Populus alba x Populus x berolinensis]|uniref:Cysteine-rich receptor-like protein kinase 25 n=1 Tax=Populus alba x Populus x berolinensis TaxID=444605 RepID=A0AAD6M4C6_9ROSI|nr:cysteine-rich receptor-like protein kinase 25 [Populus alba x Populus x berolinensis]
MPILLTVFAQTILNYSANSTFQNNLEILMSSIRSNASVSKLYYTSTGNDLDRISCSIYVHQLYKHMIAASTCITAASQDIMQVCPGDKEAVVWEELCQLRYSNQSFLGHLDVSGNIAKDNQKDVENPEQFGLVVNETLSDLTKQVAFNASANMYATRQAAFTNTETLCCDASRGGRVLSRSCYLRYELYAFYERCKRIFKKSVPGKRKKQNTRLDRNCHGIGHPNNNDFQLQNFQRDGLNDGESAFLDLESIYAATGNFSDSNLLGQGGFGPVYKHKNLVKLLGLCVDGDEKLLVYEFMPNRSLDVFLFDKKERARLNWRTRNGIVNGIAKGTLYLHEDSRHRSFIETES